MTFDLLNKNIESAVGMSIDEIKSISPEDYRAFMERKNNSKMRYSSEFPSIGRGNILREDLIDGDALNAEIDELLGVKI
jgi:hypothetical protein